MFILALAAALVTSSAAQPSQAQTFNRASGPVAPLVGNTIEVRYGEALMVSHFAPDGTFSMKLPDGRQTSGDWLADDRNMCWITRVPAAPAGENVRCERIVPGKTVGDTWTQTDAYGDEATVTLVSGDQVGSR